VPVTESAIVEIDTVCGDAGVDLSKDVRALGPLPSPFGNGVTDVVSSFLRENLSRFREAVEVFLL